jgi:Glycosyl hydrolase family 79 C-terminal beta domain
MRWRWRLMVLGGVLAGLVLGLLATQTGDDAAKTRSTTPTSTGARATPARATPARATPTGPGKLDSLPSALTISLPQAATGRRVPDGFLGFSFEFSAVRAYTGDDPSHINPVFEQLIRNLSPGRRPVIRIGGDSTDRSYAPSPRVTPPPYVAYPLTPGWMATTAALAHQLRAKLTMGLNLVANDPALAAAEARDYVSAFGRGAIEALEIGNEPNIYSQLTVDHTLLGIPLHARPRNFGYPAYRRQFHAVAQAVARAAPHLELAGPALAVGPTPTQGSWVNEMADFLARDPRVRTMTVHRYPLRNCYVPPSSPQYPTVAHLLSTYSTAGLAASLGRWLKIAHQQHRQLRVDELNSVACRGSVGVSDTFASALWVTDALFSLLHAGVDGVNIHTLPAAAYELFAFSDTGGQWSGAVRPVYYGLQLFAQAAPPGSRLLAVPGLDGGSSVLSVWATRGADRVDRLVLIDKDPARAETVTVRPPAGNRAGATLERMQAPSVESDSQVTLGGQTYGPETTTGQLAPAITQLLTRNRQGNYTVRVPAGSAALVTLR